MEQRPLRLGDIVDDYCPRERRLTNHVVVALVGDAIRQTRCSTCDTEHVYKEARVPKRKKKDDTAALYDQVLADASPAPPAPPRPNAPAPAPAPEPPPQAAGGESPAASDPEPADDDRSNGHHDLWPAHRRLIRASLPRTDTDPPVPRPIPEFTMHQRPPQHRGGGGFRHGHGQGQGHGHGQWQGNGQPRFGAGHGRPQRSGPAGDEPNGNVPPGQGKGRRRSRRGGKHRRPR